MAKYHKAMRYRSHLSRFVLIFFFIIVFVYFFNLISKDTDQHLLVKTLPSPQPQPYRPVFKTDKKLICQRRFTKVFSQTVSGYRHCLIVRCSGNARAQLPAAVQVCMQKTVLKHLDVRPLPNSDDIKFAILPNKKRPKDVSRQETVAVTLGIGNDIDSERQLLNLLPNCKFYGADPIPGSGAVFREVGEYFPVAVSGKTGLSSASVLEDGKYIVKEVETISLVDFLMNFAKSTHVDYLFIDNEGAEYKILPQLLSGETVEKNGIVVCQIFVEVHGPSDKYDSSETGFQKLMMSFLEMSAFLPIWVLTDKEVARLFYINVESTYCVDKFYKNQICNA